MGQEYGGIDLYRCGVTYLITLSTYKELISNDQELGMMNTISAMIQLPIEIAILSFGITKGKSRSLGLDIDRTCRNGIILTVQDTTPSNQDILLTRQDQQTSAIRRRLYSVDFRPRTRSTEIVCLDHHPQASTHCKDCHREQSHRWRLVVNCKIHLFGAVEFVRHDVLAKGQGGNNCHAGAEVIGVVDDVVDYGAPGEQVGRDLMDQFLAVTGVALVRVVVDESVVVNHQEGLPDGCESVVGKSLATVSNVRDEFPRVSLVRAGVEFKLSLGKILRDGVTGKQDGAN
ncbi:BNR/Asp-box repeat protein, partial [Aureobasidium melanogenum]